MTIARSALSLMVLILAISQNANAIKCDSAKNWTLKGIDRKLVLDLHNKYRSTLAKGLAPNKGDGYAAPAKNMFKLKWDCALEESAQKWASQCIWDHSDTFNGENLAMKRGYVAVVGDLLADASHLWWKELIKFGIPTNDTAFNSVLRARGKIGHFTQMAWAKTKSLGCGVANHCSNFTNIVVCHYAPSGNYGGAQIYEIGAACKKNAECPDKGSKCSADEGLCKWK